jgi:phage terminase large subunit
MIELPKQLGFLLTEKCRYKGAYGGRGSAKSWTFARALLILGAQSKMRILCAREIQKSIKQSVHKLLSDQIQALGLGGFYEVLETEIRGKNGTEFSFSGLATHTIDSIKSYEGCDICWIEEAHTVSKRSWDVLIPTIRKVDSEIWVSFNPELETDDTYQRFVANPPENSHIIKMNYDDNPWFSDVLEQERIHCQLTDPKAYKNIWEGLCLPAASGAIWYDEIAEAEANGRIGLYPYDPMLKVHLIFDLGWNDAMVISLVQVHQSSIRIIHTIKDSHKTLDQYSNTLKDMKLNWGAMYLPHDGRNKDFKTGKSAQEIMQKLGWDVRITPGMSIEDGIRMARIKFGQMYFNKPTTEYLVQSAKRYKRAINQQTNEPGAPLHDEWSHGGDNIRYIAINAESMTNDDWKEYAVIQQAQPNQDGIYF